MKACHPPASAAPRSSAERHALGKHKNAHGLECLWASLDAPPDLVFDDDGRGKRIYFAVRWESSTNKKGPWSEVFSAIVP